MSDLPGRPNFSQLMETVIDAAGEEIRVGIPGVIKAVDLDNSHASVQPAVRRADSEADPVLVDVPLLFPVFGRVKITWPVESGDPCWIMFADRSLEEWESKGGDGEVEPVDPRTHDLTDAVALPFGIGGASLTRTSDITLSLTNSGLLGQGAVELRLQDDGKLALGNSLRVGTYKDYENNDVAFSGTAELVQLVIDLVTVFTQYKSVSDGNLWVDNPASPTVQVWADKPIWNQLAEIKAKLESIKGSL